ncbi:metallophosphoesterase [Bacillus sp. SA1-12]|uniref:metallophosphoesterase n=1 Tax=Bacillus sp. SA1-12 TaxID=1455638 RepID=UPI0006250CC7|nr:metallophosphoesterase [Bacillus sp. SA1-12]KKI93143.1 metallophosphoesterase [Bacillus sp. SA1-12]
MLLLMIVMLIKAKENHLTKHTLSFNEFPKSFGKFTIFFISDIHRRTISTKLLEQLPSSVNLVIIGGDLTESGVPFQRVEQNLIVLKKIAPVYFVFGNNDYEVGKERLEHLLKNHGVTILNNTTATISSKNREKLVLLGVEDMSMERDRLDLALEHSPKTDFRLLISHNPEIYDQVRKSDRISFIIGGHTHGGQIRLFGLGLYKKGKLHSLPNATLLISNGYGTSGLPLRLGAPAEAHIIQLKNPGIKT